MGNDAPAEPDYEFWEKVERYNDMIVAANLACDINPDEYPTYISLPTKPWAVLNALKEHTGRNLESPVTREELRTVCRKMGLKPKLFYPRLRQKEKGIASRLSEGDLNLIGALVRLYWAEVGEESDPESVNQAKVIEILVNKFGKAPGMRQRTLEGKISAALKSLKNSLAK
ncbi:MAG: hypothetical protein ACREVK_05240 [Gammaproteobacteria bacterium]